MKGTKLQEEQLCQLKKLLYTYCKVFSMENEPLRVTNLVSCRIDTSDAASLHRAHLSCALGSAQRSQTDAR